jgi:hypothetical protein
MLPFVVEIQRALNHELYYPAIMLSLTVPDICAALDTEKGTTDGELYKKWYREFMADYMEWLTDNDCWHLRCGVVHQGRMGHPKNQYSRVYFTLPAEGFAHKNITFDALNLDAVTFCKDMANAAQIWFKDAKNLPHVQANLVRLIQYRPQGLEGHIGGLPIIA